MKMTPIAVDGIIYSDDGKVLKKYPKDAPSTYFIVPETVEIIDSDAFAGAKNLRAVYINSGIKGIMANAFFNCPRLEAIFIPDTACDMRSYIMGRNNCTEQVVVYVQDTAESAKRWGHGWNTYQVYEPGRPPYCTLEAFDRYYSVKYGSDGAEVRDLIEKLKKEEN